MMRKNYKKIKKIVKEFLKTASDEKLLNLLEFIVVAKGERKWTKV